MFGWCLHTCSHLPTLLTSDLSDVSVFGDWLSFAAAFCSAQRRVVWVDTWRHHQGFMVEIYHQLHDPMTSNLRLTSTLSPRVLYYHGAPWLSGVLLFEDFAAIFALCAWREQQCSLTAWCAQAATSSLSHTNVWILNPAHKESENVTVLPTQTSQWFLQIRFDVWDNTSRLLVKPCRYLPSCILKQERVQLDFKLQKKKLSQLMQLHTETM